MTLTDAAGWTSAACMLPLFLMAVRRRSSGMTFVKKNHYLFGWLMLFLAGFHALFRVDQFFDQPFGIGALAMLGYLNSFLFIKKKTREKKQRHTYASILCFILIGLHIFIH
ncbi:hypothetical protein NRIC_20800 [Enterococcus florum]|uniref:Uncharacterized protein n=1 Tax=Enterococcus florum TaxID=2480627 RepID=A0A4V0WPK6_9ENTE|nr:energy-coupled thiamine transporter ThiT [Enterococcus florum]GCF94189.1 hypothetical protein NRIC_20800 [Enterococcus florum]